jgi:hypothetical protein
MPGSGPPDLDLTGAWDLHVHAGPCLFPRWGDAWDLVRACTAAGMGGVLLKSHHGSTVESASLISRHSPDLIVHGGITLNGFVGGLNPMAVEAALALGGRAVWLPTIHARHHEERCGCLGGFGFQGSATARVPAEGYTVNQGDRLRPEVHDILDLVHGRPVALATGHISAEEISVLATAIRERGLQVRLLVNHVCFTVPALGIDQLRALAGDQVWFETAYLSISPLVRASSPEAVARLVLAVPEARWIMVSDSGQTANPPAPDALRAFAAALGEHQVSEARLRRMLVDEPAALLA